MGTQLVLVRDFQVRLYRPYRALLHLAGTQGCANACLGLWCPVPSGLEKMHRGVPDKIVTSLKTMEESTPTVGFYWLEILNGRNH